MAVPADLAELQTLLDSLADDQSRIEAGVLRVRSTNYNETQATTQFVARERLAALRKEGGGGLGPGSYDNHEINKHVQGRRATGGLIQPLPKNQMQRRKKKEEEAE